MRHALFGGIMGCVLVVAAATSRSDTPPPEEPPPPALDLGSPATVPLGPNPPHDPATPHDPGPPGSVWHYEDLTAAEQAVVDRGLDVDAHGAALAVHANAIKQALPERAAMRAQRLLGILELADTGVVP